MRTNQLPTAVAAATANRLRRAVKQGKRHNWLNDRFPQQDPEQANRDEENEVELELGGRRE